MITIIEIDRHGFNYFVSYLIYGFYAIRIVKVKQNRMIKISKI